MANPRDLSPIGYAWLAREFKLNPMPHHVESFTSHPGERRTVEVGGGRVREIHPLSAIKLEGAMEHLDFALKREGLHLGLLRTLLPRLPEEEVVAFVRATPTGANARRVWYLYEQFAKKVLPIPDVSKGNYIDLADPEIYFTGPVKKFRRWRINHNLLGDIDFSPIVRRSRRVLEGESARLDLRCREAIADCPAEIYQRALAFLYSKETKSSYAIENETPDLPRTERFVAQLRRAAYEDFLSREALVELQNLIVDPRFAADGWRTKQNYVGQTLAPGHEKIHLVPPKPGSSDLDWLMDEWIKISRLLAFYPHIPPIAAAAVVAWIFVYLHPFEDGNGRIHRFLIHHVLARLGFTPEGVLLPISAIMLNRQREYDASLEAFSQPLLGRSDYELDDGGRLVVNNETKDLFRYIDCTPMVEALYAFATETIESELPRELSYLRCYDVARQAMREVVDMPEPQANLFLRLCLQNQGRLSGGKRHKHFEFLSDDEVRHLETAIQSAYHGHVTELPSRI